MITIAKLQELAEQVEQKRNRLGLSQNKCAKTIGVSGATLSNLVNEKFVNDTNKIPSPEMIRKLENWVYSSNKPGWNLAPTRNFKRVVNICKHAQDSNIARAISFKVGTGKSHALKHYADNFKNAFYIECEEYYTRKTFLNDICKVMGISIPPYSSIANITNIIIHELNTTQDPLLIIDEADKLKDGVINFFKTFYNKTQGNAGFILCGAPHFKSRLEKGMKKQKQAYQEIHSRFGGRFFPLYSINKEDVQAICAFNGIDSGEDQEHIYNNLIKAFGNDFDLRNVKSEVEQLKIKKLKQAS